MKLSAVIAALFLLAAPAIALAQTASGTFTATMPVTTTTTVTGTVYCTLATSGLVLTCTFSQALSAGASAKVKASARRAAGAVHRCPVPPVCGLRRGLRRAGEELQHSRVVLLQYHLHMRADPMTNPDTEGRAKFYGVNSTPSMLVNGAKKMVGGGGMAAAEKKYGDYCAVINPLLETAADCKLTATAKRVGDKIQLQAQVSGVEKPGAKIKLHLVVAEEAVRLVGATNCGSTIKWSGQCQAAWLASPS